MSEMTIFQSGAQLPDYLRKTELSELTKSLMGGGTYKRISIEGGVFRMLVGGKEVAKNEDRAMNMVIIRASQFNSRTYYGGTYVKGQKTKPQCWSDDGTVPSAEVKTPQSPNCAQCPQNIKGSGQGENTKACRWNRRVAVLLENDMDGDIYAMSIPAASVFDDNPNKKGLQTYAKFLGGFGVEVNGVVTEMRFDLDVSSPKLAFNAIRPLTPAEYEIALRRKDEKAAVDACTMLVADLDGGVDVTEASVQGQQLAKPAAPTESPFKVEPKAAAQPKATPKAATVAEPTVRASTKPAAPLNVNAILDNWVDD